MRHVLSVEPDLKSLENLDLRVRQFDLALSCFLEGSVEGGTEEVWIEAQQIFVKSVTFFGWTDDKNDRLFVGLAVNEMSMCTRR